MDTALSPTEAAEPTDDSWVSAIRLAPPPPGSTIVLRMTIPGEPVAKERPRVVLDGAGGRAYTPAKTRAAEDEIAWLIADRICGAEPDAVSQFGVMLVFHCKSRRHRDVDNLEKAVLDAVTRSGRVWRDDHQVTLLRTYRMRGDPPHTDILIFRLPADLQEPV